jgi:serine/threonine protein kinase
MRGELQAAVTQHQRVFGRYHLLGELGHGGMSDVFLASSDGSADRSKLVVVKRLRNLDDPQRAALFADEARTACRLSHPNLVRTLEVGVDEGHHFLVMEYLHGPTLRQLRVAARSRGGLPWPVEVTILSRVLEGLHHAHELRAPDGTPLHTVHRDLSPENVIVTSLGETKLLDFGIAKATDSVSSTQAGVCRGKLRNMPPEQLRGERVDRRADVYAAGVMLWEGLSGRSLWAGLTDSAVAARVVRGEPPQLEAPAAAIPAGLRTICARALARAPEARFPTAGAFAEALAAHLKEWRVTVSSAQLAVLIRPLFAEKEARIDSMIRSRQRASAPTWSARLSTAIAQRFGKTGHTASFTQEVPTTLLPARNRIVTAADPLAAPPAGRRVRLDIIAAASLIALSGYGIGQFSASRALPVEVAIPIPLPPRLVTGAPEPRARQEPPVATSRRPAASPAPPQERPPHPRAATLPPRIRTVPRIERRLIDAENPYRALPPRAHRSPDLARGP